MGKTFDALHRLQEIETNLAELRGEIEGRRRQALIEQRAVAHRDEEAAAGADRIRCCQMEIDRLDLDIKSREAAMVKHREALNRAKTNKDYAAILSTLNTEKADAAKLENRQLELMTELDALHAAADAERRKREEIRQRLARAQAEFERYREETSDEVARLQALREEAAANLPPHALATFNRAAEKHEGEAMVPIRRINPKREEYACGGCNMSVTLEHVSVLRNPDLNEVMVCQACSRILFIDEQAAAQAGK